MTSLLVVIVLFLLGFAIWQMTKIFNLTQLSKDSNTEIANDKDNNLQGYLMFGFLVFLYAFIIYGLYKWGHLVLSNPSSEHGKNYDLLLWITLGVIFFVLFITQALLHFYAFKYRGADGKVAKYYADDNKLELVWTIIPAIVLTGLISFGLYTWSDIMYVDEDEEVIFVELYAKQFSWEARYAGDDNTLGKANVRLIEGVNTMGVDLEDPNALDDKAVSELHLPKGKKVVFKIRSQDVLHSAYMPHFRAQMNCVPGMVTQFAFIPTITTDEIRSDVEIKAKVHHINQIRAKKSAELVAEGKAPLDSYEFDYLLLCNKICGASHYNMQMKIVVDTPEDFKAWIKNQKTIASTVAESKKQAIAANTTTINVEEVATQKVDSTEVIALAKEVKK